jgi:prolyl-tRNA synthetase
MFLSKYFLPTLKETPSEAHIISHRYMLRAGMIRQSASGIYTWLPLGLKVLRKIEKIVREEQNKSGAQEILMPTIQPAELWIESGRYEDYGKEMLRVTDRHERKMLYGPTNEELVTALFRDNVKSLKELPKNLYHIQWKFRDEVRPRFGVMRGREFLMKDAYSFDIDKEGARRSYNRMFMAYMRTFARMGLKAIPMKADTGPIGGDLSHEFHILAETGESAVFVDKDFLSQDWSLQEIDFDSDLQPLVDTLTSRYSVTEEKRDLAIEKKLGNNLIAARGIEVGQIFYFGTKYSEAMKAKLIDSNGEEVLFEMGSYGIGVSRLLGGIIEAHHDDKGICWPETVAPYLIGLINLKKGDLSCDQACQKLYHELRQCLGDEVLYDDRDERAGVKFSSMDLIGLPWQIIIGPKGIADNKVEIKHRLSQDKQEMSIENVIQKFSNLYQNEQR